MKIRDTAQRYSGYLQQQHRLLLRAALLDKQSAVPAFEAWHQNADWAGTFDSGTYQLLPQLYVNLDRHGYDDPIMGRLRGLYRNAWYRNQQLLVVLQNLIERLRTSGIWTMLLGDAALMHGYCISPGARSLTALDILIPFEHATAASEIMGTDNWKAAADSTDDLRYRQHARFTSGDDRVCTLYWYSRPKSGLSHDTSWERAIAFQLNGIDTLIPDAPEMLVHQVCHGLTELGVPTLPGLAATAIIIGSEKMDWSAASRLASENYMGLKLYLALATLKTELGMPIPDTILDELGNRPVSLAERLELRAARKRPDAKDNFFGPLERLSLGFLQYTGKASPTAMMAELPEFLRYRYGTDSLLTIVGNVFLNGLRRIGRLIGRLFKRDPNRLVT